MKASTPIPSTTAVPQKPSSTVVTTAVVSPTPTATPTIISEATTTLQGSTGKIATTTPVVATSPSPGISSAKIETTTPICEETDGMGSITTIPSTEITSNDKKADIENLRPSSKTPFKSSEGQLVIEYMPSKTRPIANVELVSTDNIKTYTVQFFNADGTVTTRKVKVGDMATSIGTKPDVRKVTVTITPDDKEDSYRPVQLQLSVHACFEVTSTPIPSTTAVPQKPSSTVVTTAVVSPTPTATPTIISEATTTLQGSTGKIATTTPVVATSPSPGISSAKIETTTPICEETDGMGSITTIPSTEITSNDKKADIENLRPSSKTPFKSSEGQLVIEYMPSKTRPIANVELVSTDNIKTYTVQFFNADGTVTTRKVKVGDMATSIGTKPDVRKVTVTITPDDKEDSYRPVQLQLSVHACFEVTSTPIPSTTAVPQKPSSTVVTTAVVSPTPTATPTIISEATTTLQGSTGKIATTTPVVATSPSPGISSAKIETTTPICEETDGMGSITTIPSTEITSNDKKADIENLRPSSKTPFKSSEGQLVIEYMPSKTRPIANVELVSTDNIKTYTVQFFNADGTVTTRKVKVGEMATSIGTKPDVRKVTVTITPDDKEDSYRPVQLQLSVHACFEVTSTPIPSTIAVPQKPSSTVVTTAVVSPTPTATPTITSEATTTLQGSTGKIATTTPVVATSPSPGISSASKNEH
ncbi:uncharacterized protein LOC143061956 [Mytilus galloprovincialis]|uniref:uncharacterized protein LOC143061956 n=1 Tax=Mytilus galloprovincialis TaxID=29158 RepID=UPI003F7C2233